MRIPNKVFLLGNLPIFELYILLEIIVKKW